MGPKSKYGGVSQHIEGIKNHSTNNITIFDTSSPTDFYTLFISKYILTKKYDIIHLHGHPWWPKIYSSRTRGASYIHTVHGINFREDFKDNKEWKIRNRHNHLLFGSCHKSDIVISVAQWQQRYLLNEGITSVYIPNGINVQKCELSNAERCRTKYCINDDFILFGGDIRWYKRPVLFIELARRNPQYLFVMKGAGLTNDNIQQTLGITIPKNLMCLGQLPHQDVLDVIAASRVLVLASKNDTFPTAILEAMALKKVVVGANNAGTKEIITDKVDGFLFESDDIDDLENKTLLAFDNPNLGEHGYTKVIEKFDWRVVIKQLDALYDSLVS
jgi:glycosyltransferase involved in cell wall biosynthesis